MNDPPLIHASKPNSTYRNDRKSYKALTELLTRARLIGSIPFNAIHDPTRSVEIWNFPRDVQTFIGRELDNFLKGYYRDLQQSQPNHIEIVAEKNTILSIIRPVASHYCIPYSISRGYTSLPPRYELAKRFRQSGKESLILLVLSDFDPEGEDIARNWPQSLRDDFGINEITPHKVALTDEQVEEMELPSQMQAKETSSRYAKFAEEHGDDVYELEAVPPEELQAILRTAIDSVLDIEAFNAEIDREKEDAVHLDGVRRAALGCSWRHVLRMADRGLMPYGYKLGSLRRFDLDEIQRWISGGCKPVRVAGKGAK